MVNPELAASVVGAPTRAAAPVPALTVSAVTICDEPALHAWLSTGDGGRTSVSAAIVPAGLA